MTDFAFVDYYVLRDTPDYLVTAEEFRNADGEQMMFLHMLIFNFRPSVLKQLLKEWHSARHAFPCPFYAGNDDDDEKWERLVSKFGFKFLTRVPCTDGRTRRLFINLRDFDNGWSDTDSAVLHAAANRPVDVPSAVPEGCVLSG